MNDSLGSPMPSHGLELIRWMREHSRCWSPSDARPARERPAGIQTGDWACPKSGNEWGQVVRIDDNLATVCFGTFSGRPSVRSFRLDELRTTRTGAGQTPARNRVPTPTISSDEMLARRRERRFLIKGILPAGQNCVIGGRTKTLKTGIMLDMAYSLATGTMFLRKFEVPKRVKVAVISGESGLEAICDTASRIAHARGATVSGTTIRWGFELPRLSREDEREALEAMIKEHKVDVVFIDPLYLSLLDATQSSSASNLYAMGSYLLPLSELAARNGVTLVILHHCRKGGSGVRGEQFTPPELEELSLSGIAEWARAWFLLSRRETFDPEAGLHRLWASVGGSAGHSHLLAIDVREGSIEEPLGRTWDVEVTSPNQARLSAQERREETKTLTKAQRDANKRAENRRKVIEAIGRFPDGETESVLRTFTGMSGATLSAAVADLLRDGLLEICAIDRGKRRYQAVRCVRSSGQLDKLD